MCQCPLLYVASSRPFGLAVDLLPLHFDMRRLENKEMDRNDIKMHESAAVTPSQSYNGAGAKRGRALCVVSAGLRVP